ncbi:trigger factor [Marinobacterium sediminicola]|uniref:Trigger factor n=1 Tax=Marinobacterium sediminicola TaxID=518898 RepID=A0ABY1S2D0_9GAMM|nr:trigger factor [Marinobacterium sediminicola]ULG70660.1 trigger factor [Marinobacterium sediminicola]SMR77149.1 trigger factor [Marinobacterium sediminicola]
MQVSVETTSGLERQMTITVPAERIDQDVDKLVAQQARTRRLDGFRPGKVPPKVIKRMFGSAIRQDVLGQVVQETFYTAVEQEKLQPAGGPSIEFKNDKEGEDLQYVATFEVYPEIELKDLSGVELEKQTAEIADADLDKMIETLQKQQANWVEVDRAAADGDRIKIDFEGFIDGEAFEGGKAEGHDLVLGSGAMIPGFEAGLEGKKAGEEFDLEVSFPEDYHAENLKGKAAVFKTKVQSVSAQELPELNEEFFSRFGIEEKDLDGFKGEVRKNMERELKQALKMKLKDQVFTQLLKVNDIEVPSALIDSEIDNLRRQAIQQFGGPNANIDPNMLPKEMFEDQAKRRVSVGLLVQEVVKTAELKADEDRVRETIEEMASTYQDAQQVIDWYYGNDQILNQIKSLVLEDQVVDHLVASAKVTEKVVPYEEAIQPAQQQAEAAEAEESEA